MESFEIFWTNMETVTGRKLRRIRTDGAFDSPAWKDYYQKHRITHEITVPYSSAQNGLV